MGSSPPPDTRTSSPLTLSPDPEDDGELTEEFIIEAVLKELNRTWEEIVISDLLVEVQRSLPPLTRAQLEGFLQAFEAENKVMVRDGVVHFIM